MKRKLSLSHNFICISPCIPCMYLYKFLQMHNNTLNMLVVFYSSQTISSLEMSSKDVSHQTECLLLTFTWNIIPYEVDVIVFSAIVHLCWALNLLSRCILIYRNTYFSPIWCFKAYRKAPSLALCKKNI